MKFDELNLPEPLLKAIRDLGFETPTPIQAQALPLVLEGRDVAGQAQTGTGKTACFLLGTMTNLLSTERQGTRPRALVVAPTRELALQIADDAVSLNTYCDFGITVVCGGLPWGAQARDLEDGTDIVIGTPGRLIDMVKSRKLDLSQAQAVVIDEADRMFDMGFVDDLYFLFRQLPDRRRRQSLLFSATLSPQVMRLASRHMNAPTEIKIDPERLVVERIDQKLYHVGRHEKVDLLLGLLQKEQPERAMVFVNRKVDGEELAWKLNHNGYESVYLSGDLQQKKRLKIVDAMKAGKIPILVATDVASRGIHVDDVSHVFNYDVPQDAQDYVHRIGRTARAGRKGTAITLADEYTVLHLEAVEELIEGKVPVAFADDDLFIPDRAQRFRRAKNPYTGWPPSSMKDDKDALDDDDDTRVESRDGGGGGGGRGRGRSGGNGSGDGGGGEKKKRRRRRSGGKKAGSDAPAASPN